MATIIRVDFNNKKKYEGFDKHQWPCNCCGASILYDSRKDFNLSRVEVCMNFKVDGAKITQPVSLCSECIKDLNNAL